MRYQEKYKAETKEWSFAFPEEELVSVSTDYTHASWQVERRSGLSGFGCFGLKKKKYSAQSLCSKKLFYC